MPDRSYLIPQLHKNPAPGQVHFEKHSTIIKNKRDKTLASRLVPNQLTWLKTTWHTKKIQDLDLTLIWISILRMVDLLAQNMVILHSVQFTPKLKDSIKSSKAQALQVIKKVTRSMGKENMYFQTERAMVEDCFQRQLVTVNGWRQQLQALDLTHKLLSSVTMETEIITKLSTNDDNTHYFHITMYQYQISILHNFPTVAISVCLKFIPCWLFQCVRREEHQWLPVSDCHQQIVDKGACNFWTHGQSCQ